MPMSIFFATSLEQKWIWGQENLLKLVDVTLVLLIYLVSQQYQ